MDFSQILFAALVLGVIGLVLGLALGIVGKVFAVKEDEKALAVREVLPGVNCGACGFPGCDGFSKAVAEGKAKVSGCAVGGDPVAKKVATIMGVEETFATKLVAFVKCAGTTSLAKSNYKYEGIHDCNAISMMAGSGPKACTYGCLGYGSCVAACPFDAIDIAEGIAKIDPNKCVACGLCVPKCPKNLIEIVPDDSKVRVQCNSNDTGPVVRKHCSAGCISCKLCERNCPHDAIHVIDNLARVDYAKCTLCGICVEKCPTDVIKNLFDQETIDLMTNKRAS